MNESKFPAETSKKQKKWFFWFLGLYFSGYIMLLFIGNTINLNPNTPLAFLSPLAVLLGSIGIVFALIKK